MIVAVIALVFALMGAAYAASGALTGKQKKEVEKIAKKFAGKPGAPGAQGAAGANGKDGANGTNGTNGTPGTPGAPGKSVKVTDASPVQCNELGGVIVEKEGEPTSAKEVCNGEPGEEGSPWTAGGTLPPGATETGTWSMNGTTANTEGVYSPMSFAIKLASPIEREELSERHVHYKTDPDFATFCEEPAIVAGPFLPDAQPGEMCIWEIENNGNAEMDSITPGSGHGESERAARFGALLHFKVTGTAFSAGSWAVTGCGPGAGAENECP
jgi:hypothetical protein